MYEHYTLHIVVEYKTGRCSLESKTALSTCSTGEEKYTEMKAVGAATGQLKESECNIVPETAVSSTM